MKIFILQFFFYIFTVQCAEILPKSFSIKFEQTSKSNLSGKEKKGIGSIEYLYPGKIKFVIDEPDKVQFVSNNEKTWYYTPPFIEGEKGEVSIRSNDSRMPLLKFFDSLEKGDSKNSFYDLVKDHEQYQLSFTKDGQKTLGIIQAIFTYNKGSVGIVEQLKQIEISYTDKRKVLFSVKEIKKGVEFSKEHFNFVIPPNTQISK